LKNLQWKNTFSNEFRDDRRLQYDDLIGVMKRMIVERAQVEKVKRGVSLRGGK
jgi:hypothetical protein